MSCFPSQVRKKEKDQNLLFLASSIQVELLKRNLGPKRKSWRMISWSSTSEIVEKYGRLGWFLVKKRRSKKDEMLGLFKEFLGNWQPDLLEKISPKHKVREVFWEIFLLQSWRELKTIWIPKKGPRMKVVFPAKSQSKATGQKLNLDRRPCLHSDKEC